MTNEERDIDRYYDSLNSTYEEESKVPLTDYRDLEERCDRLARNVEDLLEYIKNNDPAGAMEYAVKENLIWD